MPALIDTHCHLTHGRLRQQTDAVLDRAHADGVHRVICTAATVHESKAALALARRRMEVYCTAGVHPHHAKDAGTQYLQVLRRLAEDPNHVAVGEIGLDYH